MISASAHTETFSSTLSHFDLTTTLALRERVNYVHGRRPQTLQQTTFSSRSVISAVYGLDTNSQFFGLSPLPDLSTVPQLEGEANSVYQSRLANELQNRIIAEMVISPMTRDETIQYNITTLRRLERIRILEEAQEYLLPRRDVEIDQTLFAARVDYHARMYRSFRLHDLPVELIQEIFRLVCWSAHGSNLSLKSRAQISSVCSLWRKRLLSDKTMWADITLTNARDFPRAATWLGRADQAPIAVHIIDSPAKPWTMKDAQFVVDKLFTKLHNIRTLVLILRAWDPIAYILEALARAAHSGVPMIMEHLEVHHSGTSYRAQKERSTQAPPAPSLFDGIQIPTLRKATVVGFAPGWSSPVFRNLTTLDIRHIRIDLGPTIHEFRQILLSSPCLSKLCLHAAGPKWPPKALMPDVLRKPIMLSHLKTLCFAGFGCDYGAYLLAQFLCPNVIDLYIMNVVGEDYSPLYFLMTNRTPNVRSLSINGAEICNLNRVAKACVVRWLHSMPNIEFLRIKRVTPEYLNLFNWNPEDARKMISSPLLSSRNAGDPICYRLKTVEIHSILPGFISTWASRRYAWCIPITKLYFITDRGSLTDDEMRLLKMSVSGPVVVTAYMWRPKEETDLLAEA